MRIFRLAQLFELKYNFDSKGSDISNIINNVKRDIINAYNLYVNSDKAKDPVLQILANSGEAFSKSLINDMEKMVAEIDNLGAAPALLFRHINKILGNISEMKFDPEKKVRNFIHDSVRITRESDKSNREHLKSKFEVVLHRISSVLEKQAKILKAFLAKDIPLAGGVVEPERKDLSKEKLLMFSRTPVAQDYGLDLNTMEKILFYPDLKEKLTTLINAIDRGHFPINGPEIKEITKSITDDFRTRETNADIFGEERD